VKTDRYKAGSQDNVTALVVVFPWAQDPFPVVGEDNAADDGEDDVTEAVDADLDMFD
jgi:hypothetical protein